MSASISAQALAASPSRFRIIDIREPLDFAMYNPWPATNIPYATLMQSPEKYLVKGENYYLICVNGSVSLRAARILQMDGYKVRSVDGGYAVLPSLQ